MIVSCEYNESYDGAPWSVDMADKEILVIHALGVRPSFAGRGIAQAMDAARYLAGTGMKTIRCDGLRNGSGRAGLSKGWVGLLLDGLHVL